MTGPGKTGLIYTKYNFVHIMAPISCSVCAIQNLLVVLNSSWISAYTVYDDNLDTILITDKTLLHSKPLKSGQISHVDKTGFLRPGHK